MAKKAKRRSARKSKSKRARKKTSRVFVCTVKLRVDRDGVNRKQVREALQRAIDGAQWVGTAPFEIVPLRKEKPPLPAVTTVDMD